MIDVKDLTKYYGNKLAVDDISFHVAKGSVVGFLGPNGAGKSTTLRILCCYLPATRGKVTIDGLDVFRQSMEVRGRIGYMPESVPLYSDMRVGEYLRFRSSLRGLAGRAGKHAVERACRLCWLDQPEDMTRRLIDQLSRGYRQRVGLADALLHSPPVLVLDEPTLGLDPNQVRQMRKLVSDLGQQHTVIMSSHILGEVEQTCSDIVIIAEGRIAAAGKIGELREKIGGVGRLVVELKGAEPEILAHAVKELPGVNGVEHERAGSWVRLTVSTDDTRDVRGDLFALTVRNHWQLREMRRQVASLEEFFMRVTYEKTMPSTA